MLSACTPRATLGAEGAMLFDVIAGAGVDRAAKNASILWRWNRLSVSADFDVCPPVWRDKLDRQYRLAATCCRCYRDRYSSSLYRRAVIWRKGTIMTPDLISSIRKWNAGISRRRTTERKTSEEVNRQYHGLDWPHTVAWGCSAVILRSCGMEQDCIWPQRLLTKGHEKEEEEEEGGCQVAIDAKDICPVSAPMPLALSTRCPHTAKILAPPMADWSHHPCLLQASSLLRLRGGGSSDPLNMPLVSSRYLFKQLNKLFMSNF